jgi:hypothetical protein
MEAQHRAVIEALTAAMAEPRSEFKRRWEDQRHGTVVMKDLLTMSRFYEGNEAWCYMFTHCALKMPPESVVESMGKKVADHGDVKRGLEIERVVRARGRDSLECTTACAVALWLCEEALKLQYKDSKTDWRSAFSHSEARDHHGAGANRKKRKTF